jgi:predicted N-acyltransferase
MYQATSFDLFEQDEDKKVLYCTVVVRESDEFVFVQLLLLTEGQKEIMREKRERKRIKEGRKTRAVGGNVLKMRSWRSIHQFNYDMTTYSTG